MGKKGNREATEGSRPKKSKRKLISWRLWSGTGYDVASSLWLQTEVIPHVRVEKPGDNPVQVGRNEVGPDDSRLGTSLRGEDSLHQQTAWSFDESPAPPEEER